MVTVNGQFADHPSRLVFIQVFTGPESVESTRAKFESLGNWGCIFRHCHGVGHTGTASLKPRAAAEGRVPELTLRATRAKH